MNAASRPSLSEHDTSGARTYARIEAAIGLLIDRSESAPSLDELARHAGLSPFHFQRLFKRWAGVSPKQFMSYVSVEYAKAALEQSAAVYDAALDAGLSGSSRLHDLFVSVEAMTPGEYKAGGRDLVIRHGTVDTPFGPALFLTTPRGICGLDFIDGNEDRALAQARARWPLSTFEHDPASAAQTASDVFGVDGSRSTSRRPRLLMKGTNFQLRVWSALLQVPRGSITSYGNIASAIGAPSSARAVGTALAANTLAYVVPCHRVLRATGLFRSYRWGAPRRWAMLGWEAAKGGGEVPV